MTYEMYVIWKLDHVFSINFVGNFDIAKEGSDLVKSEESTWKFESSFLPESDNTEKGGKRIEEEGKY